MDNVLYFRWLYHERCGWFRTRRLCEEVDSEFPVAANSEIKPGYLSGIEASCIPLAIPLKKSIFCLRVLNVHSFTSAEQVKKWRIL